MTTVLLTAFEPYGDWSENSSWQTLVELTRNLPERPKIVTRRYPVDFARIGERVHEDLIGEPDFAIHLGQAPGSSKIRIETLAINLGADGNPSHAKGRPLASHGPDAIFSNVDVERVLAGLVESQIPCELSYHAGTYLCNALLYYSLLIAQERKLKTRSVFLHLPFTTQQAVCDSKSVPSLPVELMAEAVRIAIQSLAPNEMLA